jgi:hypothetical protein
LPASRILKGREGKGGENEEFWQSQRTKLLRNIVGLLLPVDGNVDLLRMNAILNSAPQDLQQARAAAWRNGRRSSGISYGPSSWLDKGSVNMSTA